jgi:NAD-dependent deacetylase
VTISSNLIQAFHQARHVVALTGAGISAESGVPTFRDAQTGLWAKYSPEELATPQAFQRNPRLVWDWYAWRRELVSKAAPNPGHLALAQLETYFTQQTTDPMSPTSLRDTPRFTLITQNVDGLHQRAGSQNIIELHGNINRTKCFEENIIIESWPQGNEVPPSCPHCGGPLRPDVVWFGETLPQPALDAAIAAVHICDLFLSIGTSALVHPAASLPYYALQSNAILVEINPDETPLSATATFALHGPAGRILPALFEALENSSF